MIAPRSCTSVPERGQDSAYRPTPLVDLISAAVRIGDDYSMSERTNNMHLSRLATHTVAAITVAAIVVAPPLQADNVVETIRLGAPVQGAQPDTSTTQIIEGNVDWTEQILTVYGEGIAPEGVTNPVQQRLMGFRAAKVEARRNLLEMVGEVRVDAQTTVSMAIVGDDEVRSTVSGIVRGARVVPGSQTIEDGLYRIALQIDLRNQFASAVLPQLTRPTPIEPDTVATVSGSLSIAADSMRVFTPPPPFTGLLIDARGLGLQPTMAPRIISKSGHEIYSAGFAERDYVAQMGVVGYDKDMDRALIGDRLGGEQANPLIVDAIGISGSLGGDVVVSDGEAMRIRVADVQDDFLSKCRVVFLVGPRPVVIDSTYIDSVYVDSMQAEMMELDSEYDVSGQAESGDLPE